MKVVGRYTTVSHRLYLKLEVIAVSTPPKAHYLNTSLNTFTMINNFFFGKLLKWRVITPLPLFHYITNRDSCHI